ncbi:HD5 [Enterospora canceri]|uniref:HD5 n=1 Tax=Enterospora canceri TaxID=1081671 RepID=A0A1Y1S696_9MICR|nr:HD5 [Enterospora canceri]
MYRKKYSDYVFINDTQEEMQSFCYSSNDQKRARVKLEPEQIGILETSFRSDSKPSAKTKKLLADQLGLPLKNVQVWFQNRRAKQKNDAQRVKLYQRLGRAEDQHAPQPARSKPKVFLDSLNPAEPFYMNQQDDQFGDLVVSPFAFDHDHSSDQSNDFMMSRPYR